MLKGAFILETYAGGVIIMKFYFLVQAQENEFRLFNELMYSDVKYRNVKRANFEASFTGICSDGGIVTLNWMSLDNTHNDFSRINITSQVNPITGEREVDPLEVASS
jgi:hypothetical protein